MIDFKDFLETKFSGQPSSKGRTLREKIVRALENEKDGEITMGVLFNRFRNIDREIVREELQQMHDGGLITATPQVSAKNRKTLVIRLASKA